VLEPAHVGERLERPDGVMFAMPRSPVTKR